MIWKWVNDKHLFSPTQQDEDIEATPGSMPVEWSKRGDFLEWRNPWYSHGPNTPDNWGKDFCSTIAQTPASAAAAACVPCARDKPNPVLTCDGRRSGQAWKVALCALRGCRNEHDLEVALELMGEVVIGLVHSELDNAFGEFQSAIAQQRAMSAQIFSPSVEALLVSVAAFFKQETMEFLPLHVLQYTLEFINLTENGVLCAVNKTFREAAEGDTLWHEAYKKRFPKPNGKCDAAGQGGPDAGAGGCGGGIVRGDGHKAAATTNTPMASAMNLTIDDKRGGFKRRYRERIQDPHVGDQVEVAWKGKFRLESFEVYDGTAWWLAQIVDKGGRPGFYQVHYPGWGGKWDEWVPRSRLRWGNERLVAALEGTAIKQGDSVEMWCQGVRVPGAWLEAVVHKVERGRLYLGEMLTSGPFWVEAEHVRLIKRSRSDDDGVEIEQADAYGEISAYRARSILLQALSDAGFTNSASTDGWCCSVM